MEILWKLEHQQMSRLSFNNPLLVLEAHRIDHGFEINIRGVAEDIYREIHGLSCLDHATVTPRLALKILLDFLKYI